ncbi:MAG: hypothetical protein H6740_16965 [Alphaproteobacteria bacterium]|nr:hypothetical protein [Alphaproteobacteria bacterium]
MKPLSPALLVVGLAAGCGEAEDSAAPEPELPVYTLAPYTPSYSAAEVDALIDAAIAEGLPEPFTPLAVYQRAFDAWAEDGCPVGNPYEVPGDYIGCTTSAGAFFWGPILYAPNTDGFAPAEFSVIGDGYIIDPDGAWLYAGGELAFQPTPPQDEADERLEWFYLISGTWGYAPDGDWLGARWSGVIQGDGEMTAEDTWVIRVHGSFNKAGAELFFDSLLMDAAHCGVNATGAIRLHDPSGGWYTVEPEGCSNCGPVTFDGGGEVLELGEACVDLQGPALALAARIWEDGR